MGYNEIIIEMYTRQSGGLREKQTINQKNICVNIELENTREENRILFKNINRKLI